MNNQLAQRQDQMQVLIENDNTMGVISEMLSPKEVGAFKQAMLTMATNDQLRKADASSILACGLEAVRLALPLSAGQGYIVVYKNKAQLDIGYKGWQVMAKRSGLSVMTEVVTSVDEFGQSGFGHEADITFTPNMAQRKTHDDKWLEQNIIGVLVSVKEVSTGLVTNQFVTADLIRKIAAMSPGKGSQYSPYSNWLLQMYQAKAIKFVLSKSAIDINSSLQQAVEVSNRQESERQADMPQAKQEMDEQRFRELLPQWGERVAQGVPVSKIIAAISAKAVLSQNQIARLIALGETSNVVDAEIIEGEVVDNA